MEKIAPHLVEKPWAGQFLSKLYASSHRQIGEAWLLSTLEDGESYVGGKTLSQFLGEKLPFVVKIIDARESLSIQVHPNDEWASKLENSKGKTECWLILEAKPGSGVYLGLDDGITEAEFKSALTTGKMVDQLMKFYQVKRGDFITVPAGTIHAIGGGVTLLEVQQASGITYRLWDWGRAGRELHLEKGLQVCNYSPSYEIRPDVIASKESGPLMMHADFKCFINESYGEGWFIDLNSFETYRSDRTHSDQFIFVR